MSGEAPVSASEEQRAALMALAGSRDRGEADSARAIRLTFSGWTGPRIAEAFSVREDTGPAMAQRLQPRWHRGVAGEGRTRPVTLKK